jgi:hypothetical protein
LTEGNTEHIKATDGKCGTVCFGQRKTSWKKAFNERGEKFTIGDTTNWDVTSTYRLLKKG